MVLVVGVGSSIDELVGVFCIHYLYITQAAMKQIIQSATAGVLSTTGLMLSAIGEEVNIAFVIVSSKSCKDCTT